MDEKEIVHAERPKWLIEAVERLKKRIEKDETVRFRIKKRVSSGFLVESHGVYALVYLSDMPWEYKRKNCWDIVSPHLTGKSFSGKVSYFKEETLSFRIRADRSQFQQFEFQYEIDQTYTGIVLEKTNTWLWVDFGYGFDWLYGALHFKILYHPQEDDTDFFPSYNVGDEFSAVYVGKSVGGNDIFCYDGSRYYCEEYKLIGRKIWVKLDQTVTDAFRLITPQRYVSELFLDKKDDLGMPYETFQKTLQTLPDKQRLWCKVIDGALDGTLQLKWLVNRSATVEDVLSLYSDAAVLSTYDPFLPEDKKAMLNKRVWCEPCELAYPRKFKMENQHFGTIAMDANLYQDISLSQIINGIEKIPENQRIFCKIKGVYPDGTFKLQWIVQWDNRAEKLSFPNKFSQKIKLETSEDEKKQALVGKEVWGIVKKEKSAGKKTVFIKGVYPAVLCERFVLQDGLLQHIPINSNILCNVLALEDNGLLRMEWRLPELSALAHLVAIDPLLIKQRIGEEVWVDTKRILLNKSFPMAFFEEKYLAVIMDNGLPFIRHILRKMPIGQSLLCRIKGEKDGIVQMEWLFEKDPTVCSLPIPQMEMETLRNIVELNPNIQQEQKQALVGQETWGRIQIHKKSITVIVQDIYSAMLTNQYPYHKKVLQEFPTASIISCEVLKIEDDGRLQIKWIPPKYTPDMPDEVPIKQRIGAQVWAEIKYFFLHKPMALIEGKYPAMIKDSSFDNSNFIKKILQLLPEGQQIFCKIRSIRDDIIVLDWLFERDSINYSLFLSQKEMTKLKDVIDKKIQNEKEKLMKEEEAATRKEQKEKELKEKREEKEKEEEEKKRAFEERRIAQEEQKKTLIGKETWGKIQQQKKSNIVLVEDIYPAVLEDEYPFQKILLQQMPSETIIQCKILNLLNNEQLQIKWILPQSPTSPETPHHLSIEQRIGDEIRVETEWIFPNYSMLFFEEKYLAVIFNDSGASDLILKMLKQLPKQKITCRIQEVKENIVVLEWLMKKDNINYGIFLSRKEVQLLKMCVNQKGKTIEQEIEEERQEYFGKTLYVKAKRTPDNTLVFWIENKYFARIVPNKSTCPTFSVQKIEDGLNKVQDGQQLFCKVIAIHPKHMELKWLVEDDPFVEQAKYAGKKLWLEAERNEKNELIFWFANKYICRIIPNTTNYPVHCDRVKKAMHSVPTGQQLLCKILRILPDFRMELRWMIEEDPFYSQFIPSEKNKINYELNKTTENMQTTEKEIIPENSAAEIDKDDMLSLDKKEKIKIEIPHLKAPKIVGKIDLDAINAKQKPARKSRAEKEERARLEMEKRMELKEARRISRQKAKKEEEEGETEEKKEKRARKRRKKERIREQKAENEAAQLQSDIFEQEVEQTFEQSNKNKRKRRGFSLIPQRVFDWLNIR